MALARLDAPTRPLRVEQLRLGDIPVTLYAPGGAPGPAVLIAHGFAGSRQIMAPFAVTLARAGYTAVTLDFPGHGQNSAPLHSGIADRDSRYAQLSAALDRAAALARGRGDGRLALLGHSMGSEAVVRYAQEHPDIAAVVAVSLIYDGVTPDSPRDLLVLNGALESGLRPYAQRVADQAAGGGGQIGVTYGDFAAGTARRVAFAPGVEHMGVLLSPTSMAESLAWLDASFGRPAPAAPYLDDRAPWMALLYLSAVALFWPLALLFRPPPAPAPPAVPAVSRRWQWWALALAPALATPPLLRLLPAGDLLPILVGGPLALLFALYGLISAAGLWLLRLARPARARAPRRWLAIALMALLLVGYVFLTFGLPAQLFLLNYFPPPRRLPIAAAVFLAMLPYFLADERLTRAPDAPRGAYAITKVCFMLALALAIALDPRLAFLTIIAPLFLLYFVIYGLFSGLVFRRTGTPVIGALANAAIFAWSVAAVFPLVA